MKMMNGIILFLFLMMLGGMNVGGANATIIINTGTPATPVDLLGNPEPLKGIVLTWWQWQATQFTLDQSYELMNARGYIFTTTPGNLTVAILADNGGLPGNLLYSESFYSAETSMAEWQGVAAMKWALDPDTYWLAFEVAPGSTFVGGTYPFDQFGPQQWYPGEAFLSFTPGEDGSITPDSPSHWVTPSDQRLAAKLVAAPVPEPATMLLLGVGLIGLAGVRRKFNQ